MAMQIVKNKYVNSLLLLMLGSATVHMVILFYFTIVSGNLYILNYFNILDIDLFYPNVFNNQAGNTFSGFFVVAIYAIILKNNKIE